MRVDSDVRGQQEMDFITGERILCREDWKQQFEVKTSWWICFIFCLLQMLTDGLWIIVMFLSDSHSDGTHSLQSIHCWDTFLQTWWRNKLIYIFDGANLIFLCELFSYKSKVRPFGSFSRCFWISTSTLKWTYVSSFCVATGVSWTGFKSIPFRSG